jgi:pyridoxal biosynthesis lyase PdxS
MVVAAQSEQEFTGFVLIKAEVAGNVTRTVAKVEAVSTLGQSARLPNFAPGSIATPSEAFYLMAPTTSAGKATTNKKTAAGGTPPLH